MTKKKIVCSGRVVTQINDNCMKQKNVNAIWTNIVFVPVHYVTGLAMCVLIRNIILMWPESWRIGYGNSAEQKAWVCNNSPRSAWVRFLLFICRICGMECVWKKKYRCSTSNAIKHLSLVQKRVFYISHFCAAYLDWSISMQSLNFRHSQKVICPKHNPKDVMKTKSYVCHDSWDINFILICSTPHITVYSEPTLYCLPFA